MIEDTTLVAEDQSHSNARQKPIELLNVRTLDCVILVDHSNIVIGGQQCSALRRGLSAVEGAVATDWSWRFDFARGLDHFADNRPVRAAVLVGSRPPSNDAVWEKGRQGGFQVITHPRNSFNKEKGIDAELSIQGALILAETNPPGVLVIASGDSDFVPLVNLAHSKGWIVEMAAFKSSYHPDGPMALAVDKIRPLDGCLDLIGFTESNYSRE